MTTVVMTFIHPMLPATLASIVPALWGQVNAHYPTVLPTLLSLELQLFTCLTLFISEKLDHGEAESHKSHYSSVKELFTE